MEEPVNKRVVFNEDAIGWLEHQAVFPGCSFITSLPDVSELSSLTLSDWKVWFVSTAKLILSRCPDDGVTIFYQTDIKSEGSWVDKSYLCQKAAEESGHSLLWHKIVCRVPPGQTRYGRPAYTHMLCFSRGVRAEVAKSTMDVLPQAGEATWTRGMGIEACRHACLFILSHTASRTVIDPFCGHGTVLAVANELGLDAVGVELGSKRARKARGLESSVLSATK